MGRLSNFTIRHFIFDGIECAFFEGESLFKNISKGRLLLKSTNSFFLSPINIFNFTISKNGETVIQENYASVDVANGTFDLEEGQYTLSGICIPFMSNLMGSPIFLPQVIEPITINIKPGEVVTVTVAKGKFKIIH